MVNKLLWETRNMNRAKIWLNQTENGSGDSIEVRYSITPTVLFLLIVLLSAVILEGSDDVKMEGTSFSKAAGALIPFSELFLPKALQTSCSTQSIPQQANASFTLTERAS